MNTQKNQHGFINLSTTFVVFIFLFCGYFFVKGIADYWNIPIVYKSYTTDECKYVEVRGNKVKCSPEVSGQRHLVEWVR